MNRLSVLMWLAITAAVLPLLAIPVWLLKAAITGVALAMAGTTYSLIRQSESVSSSSISKQSKHISPGFHPQTVRAEADKDTEVKTQSETYSEERTAAPDREESDDTPINVTDPNSDRFIAVNTYKSRSDRFRG